MKKRGRRLLGGVPKEVRFDDKEIYGKSRFWNNNE
jgi:hypothetical protein